VPRIAYPGSWLWTFGVLGSLLVIRRAAGKNAFAPHLRTCFCLAIIAFAAGCAGGGGVTAPPPPPPPPGGGGTPAGTYALTVTGTSGSVTRTTSINLTVK
jgi:hypothetical protein